MRVNWCCLSVLLCIAFWIGVILMALFFLDWLIIASVIALVIAAYFVMLNFIDNLIDYWRSYRD